jgi:hypothetical protein
MKSHWKKKAIPMGDFFWFFCLNAKPILQIWDFFLKNQGNSENLL